MVREDENPEETEERTVEQVIAGLEARRKKVRTRDEALPPPEERKRVRKAYGVTQGDLADELGVHRITVSAWERGTYDPTGETLDKYLAAFAHMKKEIGEDPDAEDGEG